MPVYEYFCPGCFVELELLQPMSRANENSVCPRCGAVAWRVMSGFGCRTGSYLQPAEPAFRGELDGSPSMDVATADTLAEIADAEAGAGPECGPPAVPIDVSWLTESQPYGSNLWFIHNWGIATTLRYLRDDLDTEPAGRRQYLGEMIDTKTVEANESHPGVLDQHAVVLAKPEVETEATEMVVEHREVTEQRTEVPAVRPWPEEATTEPTETVVDHRDVTEERTESLAVRPRPEEAATQPTETAVEHRDVTEERTEVPAARPWSGETAIEPTETIQSDTLVSGQRAVLLPEYSEMTQAEGTTDLSRQVVRAAWRRQGGRCAMCGRWLIWAHRGRDGMLGAWQSRQRKPMGQGGIDAPANCVILCSDVANCRFNTGHGGNGWSHYAPLEDSELPFLVDIPGATTASTASTNPWRSRLREILGIAQPKRANKRPARSVNGSIHGG